MPCELTCSVLSFGIAWLPSRVRSRFVTTPYYVFCFKSVTGFNGKAKIPKREWSFCLYIISSQSEFRHFASRVASNLVFDFRPVCSLQIFPSTETHLKFHLQKQHLLKLYGKISVTNQKLRAVHAFDSGMDVVQIASYLGVRTPSVEVYLIDTMCAGKAVDHVRLGDLLAVNEDHFVLIQEELLQKTRLNEVKQSCPSFSYNQIRFVLACLIRALQV